MNGIRYCIEIELLQIFCKSEAFHFALKVHTLLEVKDLR